MHPKDMLALHARGSRLTVSAHHGTLYTFDTFDAQQGHDAAGLGKACYFTSCILDAWQNYTTNCPDRAGRIEAETELLYDQMWHDPDHFDLDDDEDAMRDLAERLVRDRLKGGEARVIDVCLTLNTPLFLDGASDVMDIHDRRAYISERTRRPSDYPSPLVFGDLEDKINAARAQVLAEHGLDADEEDLDVSVEEAIYEAIDAVRDDITARLQDIVEQAADLVDAYETVTLPDSFYAPEDLTHHALYNDLLNEDSVTYLTDTAGRGVSTAFLSEVVRLLGFDSIVLFNANEQWTGMKMERGVTHYQILPGFEHLITRVGTAYTDLAA